MAVRQPKSDRLIELESLRGLAACTVVIDHFLTIFFPSYSAVFATGHSFAETPLFFLMNGKAAVTLFFVLSGFVLSAKFLIDDNLAGLVPATIKRWPRLAGPVLITNVASALLAISGFYFHRKISAEILPWPHMVTQNSDLAAAIREGLYGCFLYGSESYNKVIWTMKFEFFGSLLTFATTAAMLLAGVNRGG
jgi:peptidoglycan/LPS O-acetylase OafA/YrhL